MHLTLAALSIYYFQVNGHELKNPWIDEIFARCLEKPQSLAPKVKHDDRILILG